MKKSYSFAAFISLFVLLNSSKIFAQDVGINSTGAAPHPDAMLHVDLGISTTKGLLVTGTFKALSTVPNLGVGSRLMFFPGKAAFRAGYVGGGNWDDANVGYWSVAMGNTTTASGYYSTALGAATIASGSNSTAIGSVTIASGSSSTAMGTYTTASGISSTAMGSNTTASGDYSFAAGRQVSTNNHTGAFFFGDSDPNKKGLRPIGYDDQFAARFNGGYYFISSDAGRDIGVQVLPGGNSWVVMSDASLKENFLPVIGESFLEKISKLNLTTWNYKTQDVKTFRHYGPMAQDFFEAFGKDNLGTIGCDTLINQQDFLGVNLIAIQALEKRTTILQAENKELKTRLEKLEKLLLKNKP